MHRLLSPHLLTEGRSSVITMYLLLVTQLTQDLLINIDAASAAHTSLTY